MSLKKMNDCGEGEPHDILLQTTLGCVLLRGLLG